MQFIQSVARYNAEKFDKKTLQNDQYAFTQLLPFIGDLPLGQINMNTLWPFIHHRRLSVKNATINRELEVVRCILNLAHKEWQCLESVPFVRMLKEPPPRVRFLTQSEADRLLLALPHHLQPVIQYALATGCRRAEILNLEWSRVDRRRKVAWLDHGTTKNGAARGIPLNRDAMIALEMSRSRNARWVFTYLNEPMVGIGSAFKKALRRAEIDNFRFHDLRHTWASWHVMAGTPLYDLMTLGGWKTMDCVQRYAHLAPEHLATAACRIERVDYSHCS